MQVRGLTPHTYPNSPWPCTRRRIVHLRMGASQLSLFPFPVVHRRLPNCRYVCPGRVKMADTFSEANLVYPEVAGVEHPGRFECDVILYVTRTAVGVVAHCRRVDEYRSLHTNSPR